MNGLRFLNEHISVMLTSIDYISQYMDVTDEHVKAIIDHCVKYKVKPEICAWYKDMDDFYSDWMGIGYSKELAKKLYDDCKEEFQTFGNGNIIRYAL